MSRALVAAACVFALVAALEAGQAPAPAPQANEPPPVTFRVEVNYVEVDAFVTDAQGNVVDDLTADDFEVLEDGKPQKISSFTLVNLPIERAERPLFAGRAIPPDVQSNPQTEGRIYLFVLDDLHTSFVRTTQVRASMRRFIEQNFGVNDMAAIVFTSGRSRDAQDFTNNPRLLLNAVDRFFGRKLESATITRITNPKYGRSDTGDMTVSAGDDIEKMDRAHRAESTMGQIRKLAEFMGSVRGRRKAMVFISEGIDYDLTQAMGIEGSTASTVLQGASDAIAAAGRANVTIYTIDPRGLVTGVEDAIGVTNPAQFDTPSVDEPNGVGLQSLLSEIRTAQSSLRWLAEDTGGFAAINRNDFASVFDRIVRDNSTYYLLGYYPANDKRDGRVRKLQVRVKRPGLSVRARNSYIAPKGKSPVTPPQAPNNVTRALADALANPLPVAGVPVRVFAAPFKGSNGNAAIALAIEADVSSFEFTQKGTDWVDRLDVIKAPAEVGGKVITPEIHQVDMTMRTETLQRVKARGFRVISQTDLPPGRYQLRIAVGSASGKAGSVLYDLTVPDFNKEAFSMSGVAITSLGAVEMPTVKPKDPLKDYLPGPLTATREFRAGDILTLYTEIYEGGRRAQPHTVSIRAELLDETGRAIRNVTEERSSSELQGGRGGYGFTARLPLSDVGPGLYVVHVRAESSLGDHPVVERDIQIKVQ